MTHSKHHLPAPDIGGARPVVRVRERGPAKYFHGRKEVRGFFTQLREDAIQDRGGTIFLIQGPPGAGKTALLHQCAVEADRDGWLVTKLENQALHEPAIMAQNMGESYITREHRTTTLNANVIARKTAKEKVGYATVPQLLKGIVPNTGALLIVDEVQTIRALADCPYGPSVTTTLNAIHNGDLHRPVILLAGGLGVSEKAFSALGISRFDGGCIVNLGRLSEAAERAVTHDWLVKEGKARGDVTPWIDAIAAEAHGWPQHLMCYAQPAAKMVLSSNGELTTSGLAYALAQGRAGKVEYYRARSNDVSEAVCIALGNLLSSLPPDFELDEHTIMEALKVGQTLDGAKTDFNTLLHKGVIAKTPSRKFTVPIPSMHDWLVDQYGRNVGLIQRQPRREDYGLGR